MFRAAIHGGSFYFPSAVGPPRTLHIFRGTRQLVFAPGGRATCKKYTTSRVHTEISGECNTVAPVMLEVRHEFEERRGRGAGGGGEQ